MEKEIAGRTSSGVLCRVHFTRSTRSNGRIVGEPGNFKRNQSMANTAQARKRARQNEMQRKHNTSLRSELRTAIKKVRKAVEAGDKAAAATILRASQSSIDRITDKRIMHKNAASRHKSRLAQAVKAMAA